MPNYEALSQAALLLGTLYREDISGLSLVMTEDKKEQAHLLRESLQSLNAEDWPLLETESLYKGTKAQVELVLDQLREGLKDDQLQAIHEEYVSFFVGPGASPCPPWASFYLDHDQVLFGISTLDLREKLKNAGLSLNLEMNEPEDHIGLLLYIISFLAQQQDDNSVKNLLEDLISYELLPWVYSFLDLLLEHSKSAFYQSLAQLSYITFKNWEESLNIQAATRALYT